MKKPKLQVFKGSYGWWYFRLRSANGEIQFQSEAYTRKSTAVRGALAAQRAMAGAQLEVLA